MHTEEEGSTALEEADTALGGADTAFGEADIGLGEADIGRELDNTGLEVAVAVLGAGMGEAVHLDLLGGKTYSVKYSPTPSTISLEPRLSIPDFVLQL